MNFAKATIVVTQNAYSVGSSVEVMTINLYYYVILEPRKFS